MTASSTRHSLFHLSSIAAPIAPCSHSMLGTTHHVDSILVKGTPLHILRVAGQNLGLESPLQGALLQVFT